MVDTSQQVGFALVQRRNRVVEGEVLLCPYWGGELKDMAVGQYQGYRFGDWDVHGVRNFGPWHARRVWAWASNANRWKLALGTSTSFNHGSPKGKHCDSPVKRETFRAAAW